MCIACWSVPLTIRYSFTQGEVVTIYVGNKRKRFNIYKDLLIEKSPYFAASLKTCWNQTNEVFLSGNPEAFAHVVNWLFRDIIPPVDLSCCEGLASVTAFYKAADFLLIETLKNDIVDGVLRYLETNNWAFNFYSVSFLRDHYLEDRSLYKLVFRSAIRFFMNGPESFEDGGDNDLSFLIDKPELMVEIMQGIREFNKTPYDQVWKCHKCEYHEHEESCICL